MLARTIDTVWHAAGDTSADFSWYTKRAILAPIYSLALLYWLRDDGFDDEENPGFPRPPPGRRRARITRLRKRVERMDPRRKRDAPGTV